MPAGMISDSADVGYQESRIAMERGDVLILVQRWLTEAANPADDDFGRKPGGSGC